LIATEVMTCDIEDKSNITPSLVSQDCEV